MFSDFGHLDRSADSASASLKLSRCPSAARVPRSHPEAESPQVLGRNMIADRWRQKAQGLAKLARLRRGWEHDIEHMAEQVPEAR